MSIRARTTIGAFERSSVLNRRLLRQERLILDVTEAIHGLLARRGMSQSELARRLGKSRAFVSEALDGEQNLTLRTIADFCDALGGRLEVDVRSDALARRDLPASARRVGRGCHSVARRTRRPHVRRRTRR